MQLNELIEEHTLPSISKQTRVSVENLEYLLAGEWGRLPQVQALGFISILEREYHIDLSDMKKECKDYFRMHNSDEELGFKVKVEVATEESSGGSIYKLVMAAAILAAAFLAWYLFASGSGKKIDSNSTISKKESFYDSVLGWFGKPGQNKSEKDRLSGKNRSEVPAATEAWQNDRNSSAETEGGSDKADEKSSQADEDTQGPEKENKKAENKGESEEADIIKEVKKEQADQEAEESESKDGSKTAEAPIKISDIVGGIDDSKKSAGESGSDNDQKSDSTENSEEENLLPEVPSLTFGKEVGDESRSEDEERDSEVSDTGDDSKKSENKNTVSTAAPKGKVIVLHPKAKIWIGYTNLKSMKRAANVTTSDVAFDISKADYIIATGHGKLQFKGKGIKLDMENGRQHFFIISKKGVKEISHEEFQNLNKSKVW